MKVNLKKLMIKRKNNWMNERICERINEWIKEYVKGKMNE